MNNFDYQQLDEIIHSRLRLAIIAVLISVEEAEFVFIKEKVNTSDGNLSVNLTKLEKVGYVSVKKQFLNRKPSSTYKLTKKGHEAFEVYVSQLEKLIKK